MFAQPLDGYGYCGKSFTERKNKGEIRGQMRVVLRPVSFVVVHYVGRNLLRREKRKKTKQKRVQRRQATPVTNDS